MPSKQRDIFFFGNGKAEGNAKMRNLLGGKGAGLHEMTRIGIPVPPGFTISTERGRLDLERIHEFLSSSYWAKGVTFETVGFWVVAAAAVSGTAAALR